MVAIYWGHWSLEFRFLFHKYHFNVFFLKKMGNPWPLLVHFRLFNKQTLHYLDQMYVKNVGLVYGSGIGTHHPSDCKSHPITRADLNVCHQFKNILNFDWIGTFRWCDSWLRERKMSKAKENLKGKRLKKIPIRTNFLLCLLKPLVVEKLMRS